MMFDDENEDNDGISPLALGYFWSVRIISLSVEMGLIVLGFHWLDRKFGTTPILVILGTMLAIGIFMVQLVGMAKSSSEKKAEKSSDADDPTQNIPPRSPQ